MAVVVITIIAAAIVVVIGHLLASSHALSSSLFFSRLGVSSYLSILEDDFYLFCGGILAGSRISM